MTRPGYAQLEDVIRDPDFPELDLALRRGRHVDRDDVAWYALLGDAQDHLEAFYRRYGCELVHKPDGYYYLLPTGDKLSRRQLSAGDMLVGQALALLYLHPSTVERGGLHTQEELVAQLATVLGSDALIRAFNPRRRRYDERVAQKTVRVAGRRGGAPARRAGLRRSRSRAISCGCAPRCCGSPSRCAGCPSRPRRWPSWWRAARSRWRPRAPERRTRGARRAAMRTRGGEAAATPEDGETLDAGRRRRARRARRRDGGGPPARAAGRPRAPGADRGTLRLQLDDDDDDGDGDLP